MDRSEYVSRKLMDKYQDRLTIRLNRLHNRIVRNEDALKVLMQHLKQAIGPSEEDD